MKIINFRCTSCGWPLCDEKCQNGKVHQMECTVLSKCRRKVKIITHKVPNRNDHEDFLFDLKLEFSTSTSESNPAYRAIAPLRLLLLREARPEFHARFEWLMDHNEERRADRETWEHHRETVNKFIRLAEGKVLSNVDIDCCIFQRGLRRLLHGRGDRPRRRHLLDQRVLLQRRRRPGGFDLLLNRYKFRSTVSMMDFLRETS